MATLKDKAQRWVELHPTSEDYGVAAYTAGYMAGYEDRQEEQKAAKTKGVRK